MKVRVILILIFFSGILSAQKLSVEKIMQDPKWMGTFPSNVKWTIDSKHVLFDYNPDMNLRDSVYAIAVSKPNQIFKASKALKTYTQDNVEDAHEASS